MKTLILLLAASSALTAGQTRTWTQGEAADFEKGILKNLSLRSDGRLTLAPVSRELFDTLIVLPLGARPGFQRQPVRRRRHEREALSHHARRQRQDARRTRRPGDPRHRHRQPRSRLCRHIARWQGLSHRRQRQARSLLRSQGEVHLGAGVRCGGRSVRRHRRPGRDPSRDARRQGHGVFQERRDARSLAGHRRQGQSDRGHRTRRPGAARVARRRGLRAVPDAETRGDCGGPGSRWRDLRRGGRQPAAHSVVAFAPGSHIPCSRSEPGRGDRRWRRGR